MIDVIVIGKGPAGITASIYIKRAGLNPVVIGDDIGMLEKADQIDNYYGFIEGISGKELAKNGVMQAQRLGVEIIADEVIKIEYMRNFKILTKKGSYEAKAVIMASGANKIAPNIKGIKEYEGKGISYCAVCDGFFYKGKDVAVLGNGDYAVHEAMELLPIANSVTLVTNGKDIPEYREENLKTNKKEIREVRGEQKVQEVSFVDNTKLEVAGVFVAEGSASSIDFARKLGVITKENKIVVNEKMETNIKGLYAAGDCTGGLMQIAKAVYEGAVAGTEAVKFVRGN